MEFEHVGSHCQVTNCNQKDFLPFKCQHCTMTFCNEHRTYSAHECKGELARDMTSIDCPICSLSVKFDLSQDVNQVWESHYMNTCTKAPPIKKATKKCNRPDCQTSLGLTNSFTCSKCNKLVCLTHRMPEEHSCASLTIAKKVSNSWQSRTMSQPQQGKVDSRNPPSSSTLKKQKNNGMYTAHAPCVAPPLHLPLSLLRCYSSRILLN